MSETHSSEVWNAIPGYEGSYEASTAGRIRSLDGFRPGRNGSMNPFYGKILKPTPNDRGYLTVHLSGGKHSRTKYVHRLVLLTFVGEPPPGQEACHENGDHTDNRLCNLRWDTKSANGFDQVRHGTCSVSKYTMRGRVTNTSKLSVAQVLEIMSLKGMVSQAELAKRYGVAQPTISSIHRGAAWGHITSALGSRHPFANLIDLDYADMEFLPA
jgi:hypothetical protein